MLGLGFRHIGPLGFRVWTCWAVTGLGFGHVGLLGVGLLGLGVEQLGFGHWAIRVGPLGLGFGLWAIRVWAVRVRVWTLGR